MAYWKCNLSSQADTILSKENLTLAEVLDVENVIQDAKNGNKKLLDFLFQPNILEELIDLITQEPNPEIPENEKYRDPYIACELLTTDVIVISRPIVENKHLLDKLLSFVDQKPPLNPLLASFFSRTIVSFFTRSVHLDYYMYQYVCLKVLESMKEKEGFVKQLVTHIGTSAIMELILKMVKEAETTDMQLSISSWLHSEGLITQLLETLNPKADPICQYNAAQLLCDIGNEFIRDVNKPHVIIDILESTDAVKMLLETILGGEFCETSIVGGLNVLLMLLPSMSNLVNADRMDYKDSDTDSLSVIKYDDDEKEAAPEEPAKETETETENVNGADVPQPWLQIESIIIRAIIPYMKVFHQLMQEPPHTPSFTLTIGLIDPPLGYTRLQITSFLSTLVVLNHQEFINELIELNFFKTLMDLFCSYPWNNFYHTQFENCLTYAIKPVTTRKTEENPLIKHIFIDCELISFVLKLWENNANLEKCERGRRQGYMGHIIQIATVINSTLKENSSLEPLLNEHSPNVLTEWNQFVEIYLLNIIDLHKSCLGGVHPHDVQNTDEVTTSDKFSVKLNSKFPDSSFRNSEDIFENNYHVYDDMNDDGNEIMFEDLCAQKAGSWPGGEQNDDDNEDEENENDDDDENDNDNDVDNDNETEDVEEGNGENGGVSYNSSPLVYNRPLRTKLKRFRSKRKEERKLEGSDFDKIFLNQEEAFLADTDLTYSSVVNFAPWKQTFDDNANSGWADFEANFGSSTVSQFSNSVTLSDNEAATKMETESSNSHGTKSDPFASDQFVENSFSTYSLTNEDGFGSFETASFEPSEAFKDFENTDTCDKKAFESIDESNDKPLESNLDKAFGTPDSNPLKPFRTKSDVDKASNSSLDEEFGTPESNLDKAFGILESNLDKAFGTSESNVDKTFGTPDSSLDKAFEASEPSPDKSFEIPDSNVDDKAITALQSSVDENFKTLESSLDDASEAPEGIKDVKSSVEEDAKEEGNVVINDKKEVNDVAHSPNASADRLVVNDKDHQEANDVAFEPHKMSNEQSLGVLDNANSKESALQTSSEVNVNTDSKLESAEKVPTVIEEKASTLDPV